ncbi:TetR/AcrR family transcriptional regulator C-terminal domain-containing protein [Paenibacillus urinalis]|uniref:TetR/AcrR family transcriptional regulator C-terminal domain-containing protein n=1 Tax=Paenibacillus urinalis TaxID=521520 RepID=A0AAX3N4Z8_9BACL|nr:TetR/AcrR family transcriptional regulator C-terminal domain-containing protein [Paenibacillus urinalis]WDH84910.1 TetR/AcrR family transcriptional regulator C-terminal domain-containing protein [Paenibacillus urinalis]WDH96370.1 TetR/AcrR family transcriptional regulator C-terminal domain-containing protein [Paenibacillus urinalis]
MHSTDEHTLSAKSLIAEALLKLLAIQPFDKISVRAIVHKAGISRTTFYLHYQDKYDLYDQLTKQITTEFMNLYGASTEEQMEPNVRIELQDKKNLLPVTISIFDHVRQYADFYRERYEDPSFIFQLSEQLSTRMKRIFLDEFYAIFLAYGTIGYIGRWLKDGLKDSSAEVAEQLTNVALTSMQLARQ